MLKLALPLKPVLAPKGENNNSTSCIPSLTKGIGSVYLLIVKINKNAKKIK